LEEGWGGASRARGEARMAYRAGRWWRSRSRREAVEVMRI
jgi:hypothetical protein